MALNDFSIAITVESVDVRYTPSASEPRGKLFGFWFTVSILAALIAAILFLPGKNGNTSLWHSLSSGSVDSGLIVLLIAMSLVAGLVGWQTVRYARAAWPSDETLHCDRAAITIRRVPWLDFSNRSWTTHRFPLAQVTNIRFAVIASAKGRSIWGLRFRAPGRMWAMPGLEAPEAKTILVGLKSLGADVLDDPKLEKRVKETLAERHGDTSWMDTSWMDSDKK